MESSLIYRCFVLVLVLGCSGASTRVGAAEGESARVQPDGDSEPESVASTEAVAATTVSYKASTTWINHYQVPCSGWEGKHFCYLVADSENGPWRMEYDPIGGVSLEWGHVYEVALGFVDQGDVGVDAPSISTFVSEIRTDRMVDVGSTTFEFRVDPQLGELGYRYLTMTGADSGELSDRTPFVCESSQVCDLLETALGDDKPFAVSFGYGPELLPLVAVSINR